MALVEIDPDEDGHGYAALITLNGELFRTTTLGQLDEISVIIHQVLSDAGIRSVPYATIFAQRTVTIIQVDIAAPPPPHGGQLLVVLRSDIRIVRKLERMGVNI